MPLAYINNVFGTDVIVFVGSTLTLATIIVHSLLAAGVFHDAETLLLEKRHVHILQPPAWALTVLLTGLLGTAVYWLINRSTLRRD